MIKKVMLSTVLIIAVMFTACSCSDNTNIHTYENPVNINPDNSLSPTLEPSNSTEWKVAYKAYLNNKYKNRKLKDDFRFYLKDMDNNGIPELIINKNGTTVIVYTFNDRFVKLGNENFLTGTTRLLFSNNSFFPGIFVFHIGGGLEHYGYLFIENDELVYERLWNESYSYIRREKIEELSDDKQLIEESKTVYQTNSDIPWQKLNPNNINQVDIW